MIAVKVIFLFQYLTKETSETSCILNTFCFHSVTIFYYCHEYNCTTQYVCLIVVVFINLYKIALYFFLIYIFLVLWIFCFKYDASHFFFQRSSSSVFKQNQVMKTFKNVFFFNKSLSHFFSPLALYFKALYNCWINSLIMVVPVL